MRWYEHLLINILRSSNQLPQHIGMIMDGNRRFAQKHNFAPQKGHIEGYQKLIEILEWAKLLNIQVLTVYAFSIENFDRPPNEVSTLMDLFEQKLQHLIDRNDFLEENGVGVKIFGNKNLLPPRIRILSEKLAILTEKNSTIFLNIALAYGSQCEATQAAETLIRANQTINQSINQTINQSDDQSNNQSNNQLIKQSLEIDAVSFSEALYTGRSHLSIPTPCLLLRTSGETRLSDFLLYQCTFSQFVFLDVFWPELTFLGFLGVMLKFILGRGEWENGKEMYNQTINQPINQSNNQSNDQSNNAETQQEKRERIRRVLSTVKCHAVV